MKGRNVLNLNAATVMEAVQEYLDKRLVEKGSIKVVGFSFIQNDLMPGTKGCVGDFAVAVEATETK